VWSICIGRHAADATVWATIVSVLSVFDFDYAKDVNGNVIPIDGKYTDALIRWVSLVLNFQVNPVISHRVFPSHALPFKCSIFPRDKDARKLIEGTSQ
jgi:hypothetical protein